MMSDSEKNTPDTSGACLLIGLSLLLAGFVSWLARPSQEEIYSLLYAIGAILVAIPALGSAVTGWAKNDISPSHTLIFLAVIGCLAIGNYLTAALVSVILVLGQRIEERSAIGVRRAVKDLLSMSKTVARKVVGDYVEETDSASLLPGDYVEVLPGGTIPADAIVVSGNSAVDEASITGESVPSDVSEGSQVYAGTNNLSGLLILQVTRAGEGTVIEQVRKTVESAQRSRPRAIRMLEKYAAYYTPAALGAAALTFFFTGDPERGVAVLIATVPCALLLAGPTAIVASLAAVSRSGILIRNTEVLESAAEIKAVIFDKTGTLTTGQLEVVEVNGIIPGAEETMFQMAASLGRYSSHPAAKAVHDLSIKLGVPLLPVENLTETPGKGLSGFIEGRFVMMGRPSWIYEQGISSDASSTSANDSKTSQLCVAIDGQHQGNIFLADRLRTDANKLGKQLRELGVEKVLMATGDRITVANAVAEQLDIEDVRADLLPEDKMRIVSQLRQKHGSVMMVGDGLNDAPALASADVNVAMSSLKNGIAAQTSDAVIMSDCLNRIPALIAASRKVRGIITSNLIFGLAFVVIAALAAALGIIGPVQAAIIHEAGAFWVIFNSARLLRYRPIRDLK